MNIDDRRPTDLRSQDPSTHFGKFQTAIKLQRVIRFTSCNTQIILCPRTL